MRLCAATGLRRRLHAANPRPRPRVNVPRDRPAQPDPCHTVIYVCREQRCVCSVWGRGSVSVVQYMRDAHVLSPEIHTTLTQRFCHA